LTKNLYRFTPAVITASQGVHTVNEASVSLTSLRGMALIF
jgi:hypothetical protein